MEVHIGAYNFSPHWDSYNDHKVGKKAQKFINDHDSGQNWFKPDFNQPRFVKTGQNRLHNVYYLPSGFTSYYLKIAVNLDSNGS